jgi:hypothetical protein
MTEREVRRSALRNSLLRQYSAALTKAEFYRAARLDFNIKYRTGAFAVNAASAAGLATLYGSSASKLEAVGIGVTPISMCLSLFLLGAVCAGAALVAQHVDLIEAHGDAEVAAMVRERAISTWDVEEYTGPAEYVKAANEAAAIPPINEAHEMWPIYLTGGAVSTWAVAAVWIAASLMEKPIWNLLWPLFH